MSENEICVLLVDDEAHFRETLAKRLEKRGMRVFAAESGEQGLAHVAQNKTDVVVLDVKMPGLSGIETMEIMGKDHPDIQVIFLTGHADTSDGVRGIKAGAFDYLTKPIEIDHLAGKIRQAFDKVQREKELAKEAQYRADMEQQMIATERLAALGTLATGVAHEINNPLAIIREAAGWMRLMMGKPELADMARRSDFEIALSKVDQGIDRVRRITHQLLGFVQKTEPMRARVNMPELVEESLEMIRREAADKSIQVKLEFEDNTRQIHSDPHQIRQVLINLLTNAVYATGPMGTITVAGRVDGDRYILTVQDTGSGIFKEHLHKIFEPFFSTKPVGRGTGLGLYVSRRIIEQLGGKIQVQSQVGRGTVFSVTLPVKPPQNNLA